MFQSFLSFQPQAAKERITFPAETFWKVEFMTYDVLMVRVTI